MIGGLLFFAATCVVDARSVQDAVDILPPFILTANGLDYLGWMTPQDCQVNQRCDVVVVDPKTGRLFVEQRDDPFGTRVYTERTWGLSHRVDYLMREALVESVRDHWDMEVSYTYDGRDLTGIKWEDGRQLNIVYDRKGRVLSMSDEQQKLSFAWGKDSHRMINQKGETLSWSISGTDITTTDAWGNTATAQYDEKQLTGWIDPRGLETRITQTDSGFQIEQSGLRTWKVQLHDHLVQHVELVGSGVWESVYDAKGHLTKIEDASERSIGILYSNEQSLRLQRHNGFIDFVYDSDGLLVEIKDLNGRLVFIERDVHGKILRMEDAVGEQYLFNRDTFGNIKRLTLRDGREWVVERDREGRIRNLILPNQEVWGFSRDPMGTLLEIDRSHDRNFQFTTYHGAWTSVVVPTGEKWTIRRDGYQRVSEVMTPQGNVLFTRDLLGQVIEVSIQGRRWTIERDVFGNIVQWNALRLNRGGWDAIVSHQLDEVEWLWQRDGTGRLITLSALHTGELLDTINIGYDGLGQPVEWTQGKQRTAQTYNHWGWTTQLNEQWLQHDPRGMVEKVGLYDLTWRWNRDATGFPLVVKAPYDLQLGLDSNSGNGIERVRFPSGAMQTFRWGGKGLSQWYTNTEGQERFVGTTPREQWHATWQVSPTSPDNVVQDRIGIHTVEQESGIQIVDYDPFHFMQQVCTLTSCLHLSYSPKGQLVAVQDDTGLPTSIVWGWSGWQEAPLLIGGTVGVYTPWGMGVQSTGVEHVESLVWQGDLIFDNTSQSLSEDALDDKEPVMITMIDKARSDRYGVHLEGRPFTIKSQQVWLEGVPTPLQQEYPWMKDTLEAQIYASVQQKSIWNRPLALMESIGMLSAPNWTSNGSTSPLEWVATEWLSTNNPLQIPIDAVPVDEDPLETWLLHRLLGGKSDPSNSEVLFQLIEDPELQSILTGDFPFQSNKCISGLAQFYVCG